MGALKIGYDTPSNLLQVEKLRLIRIFLHHAGTEDEVVFEVSVDGKLIGRLTTTPEEMGVAQSYADALERFKDPEPGDDFRIPDYILGGLEYALAGKISATLPVWLSVVFPYGCLPLVPWEGLLQPALRAPLLRLPSLALKPATPSGSLDAIVCIAQPMPKSGLDEIVLKLHRNITDRVDRYCRLYVFADQDSHASLVRLKQRYEGPKLSILIADPKGAPDYQTARSASSLAVQNPWLVWIRHTLGNRSADVAHFVQSATLSDYQVSAVFPPSPIKGVDSSFNRFVTAEEFSQFLTDSGAWSVGFSGPSDAPSAAAMRAFHDQLARLRTGPILLHDPSRDADLTALSTAFDFLYGVSDVPPPASPAISLFCHPDGTERSWVADAITYLPDSLRSLGGSAFLKPILSYLPGFQRGLDLVSSNENTKRLQTDLTLAGKASGPLFSTENTPVWLAATQRALEQSVSRLYQTPVDAETAGGTETALKLVADIVANYATKPKGG